jgi:hypothetical protein
VKTYCVSYFGNPLNTMMRRERSDSKVGSLGTNNAIVPWASTAVSTGLLTLSEDERAPIKYTD